MGEAFRAAGGAGGVGRQKGRALCRAQGAWGREKERSEVVQVKKRWERRAR